MYICPVIGILWYRGSGETMQAGSAYAYCHEYVVKWERDGEFR